MKIILNESAYSKKFYNPIHSHDRYIVAFGGRGSGKTDSFYIKYLLELFQPYYFRLAYINKEKINIRDQQYAGFKRVAKRIGVYDLLRFHDGDYRITNPINGNSLIPKGMDDPEKTKGLDDITAIWWDEINKGTLNDFLTLNALLRSPQAKYLQFAISFNPVSEQHWLRSEFFSENNPYQLKESYKGETLLCHSTYLDNEFINQKEYLKTLEKGANGDINRMLVDIQGKWGVVSITNPFFYAFNESKHYKDERYILSSQHQIILSFDFNNNPCTLLIGQVIDKEISVIDLFLADENTISGKSPLEAVCELFVQKYINSGLITTPYIVVTGDASGRQKNADNVANKNFYSKIKICLRISDSQVKVRKANISHALSREICNGLIYNTDFHVYKSAFMVVNDLSIAYVDKNNSLNEAKKEHGLHITDAFRYFCDCVLNFDKWQDYLIYFATKNQSTAK